MKELSFDSGLSSYSLNGKCEVIFNPTDELFFNRFFDALDSLGGIQEEYGKRPTPGTSAERFEAASERDRKMREVIDGLFGAPVCESVFEGVSLCAFSDDGLPVWMNLMFSVLDEILEYMDETEQKINPCISKYTDKYKKYAAKYHK